MKDSYSENPLIRKIDHNNPTLLDKTKRIIYETISDTKGLLPDYFTNSLIRTGSYNRSNSHRLLVRWELNSLSLEKMDALESLNAYFNFPNQVRGRRDPQGVLHRPIMYPTFVGGSSSKKRGYFLGEDTYFDSGSHGMLIFRNFRGRTDANKAMKRKGWLYSGRAFVELRDLDGTSQLEFSERVVQISQVLGKGEALKSDKLLYRLYRDLTREGIEDKTEAEIGGLSGIIDFMRWSIFAPIRNPLAADYFDCHPESVLLAGVKGTGKTLIAEVLASQDNNSLFVPISSIELLTEKYVSKGRDDETEKESTLFSAVNSLHEKTNVWINLHCDDIESAMFTPQVNSSEIQLATNSTLLNKLSGIKQSKNMTLSGSTNDPFLIDDRFLRFGRIGYFLHVPLPDESSRNAILSIHTRNMPIEQCIDLEAIAHETEGYTPASLVEVCNQAGKNAMKGIAMEKGETLRIDAFEALQFVTEEDLDGRMVSDEDFQKAFDQVKPYAAVGDNQKLDRRIKAFCESSNANQIGFHK